MADENFRVLTDKETRETISNVRVGSASAMFELPEANPSFSICAITLCLADRILETRSQKLGLKYSMPSEIVKAEQQYLDNSKVLQISRDGEQVPNVREVCEIHSKKLDAVQFVDEDE